MSSLWFKKRRSADADRRVAYNISIQHGIQRTYGRLSCGSRSREAPTADRRCRPPSRRTACASSRRSRCAGVPTGRDCRAYVLLCRGPDARTGLARFDCATHSVQYSIVQQTNSAAHWGVHRRVRQGMDGPFRLTFDELNTCAVDGSVGPVSTPQYPCACRWPHSTAGMASMVSEAIPTYSRVPRYPVLLTAQHWPTAAGPCLHPLLLRTPL